MRIVGVGFLAVGTLLSVVISWGLPVDLAIALGRRPASATVLHASFERNTRILGEHPARIRYRYVVADLTYEGEHLALLRPPAPGTQIGVEYATLRPAWSRIAGRWYANAGAAALFPLLFPALGAAILLAATRSNRREIRAFTRGRPALAEVTFRGYDESTDLDERHPYMIWWSFRVPTGKVIEGSISSMNGAELEPYATADRVVVLYDPSDPACNTLYVE
jgi:hypothetical protein